MLAWNPDGGLSAAMVERLARQCFGEPNRRLSGRRELRFGHRGSVSVVPDRGVFHDFETGVGGGVLDMVVHAGLAASPADAVRLLEREKGLPEPPVALQTKARPARRSDHRTHRRAQAASLWTSAHPLQGTPAETYLREARAINVPLDGADLRFLPEAPVHPLSNRHERAAAMVARVSDAGGRGIGVHLTYLRPDGLAKADLEPARKAVGTISGGFVRIASGSGWIVAEGIETALSAWESRPAEAFDFGAAAAISAGGLARLEWPASVPHLIIAADADHAGEEAAERLARRAYASGLGVRLMRPPPNFNDWNDAIRASVRSQ